MSVRITMRDVLVSNCLLEKGRWRLLERGEAERNPEGIVAAQGRQDGGRHRPLSGPRAVSVDQVVSHQVLRSLFVVRAAW